MAQAASAQGIVGVGSRVVRKRKLSVQLSALKRRKEKHCLHEIHLDLANPVDRLELDRKLVRSVLRIEFDAGAKYMIRANRLRGWANRPLAVVSRFSSQVTPPAGFAGRMAGFGRESIA